MRILYVEDDAWMAKSVELMLKQAKYEFDTVDCGLDAVEKATSSVAILSERYDLILLDIMLPDIDGYAVIDRIRKARVNTPFLIQTGLLDRGDVEDGASLGVAEFLIKPFNKDELLEGIEKVLARSKKPNGAEIQSDEPIGEPEPEPEPVPQPEPGEEASATEKRAHRRFKTLKLAKIVGPDPFECIVMNLSYGGAAIRLPNPKMPLPTKFSMILGSAGELRCEVCWRTEDKVGVKFVDVH